MLGNFSGAATAIRTKNRPRIFARENAAVRSMRSPREGVVFYENADWLALVSMQKRTELCGGPEIGEGIERFQS